MIQNNQQEIEVWKDIPEYEGHYQISNLGKVRSLDRVVIFRLNRKRFFKGMILKNIFLTSKYYGVNLVKGKKRQQFTIHRLVATCFVSNPFDFPEVDHIDCVKTNNNFNNLEWVTSEENTRRAKENGLMPKGVDNHKSKLTEEQILDIRSSHLINVELARKYNVSKTLIGYIKKRKTWTHI
jgi:hypothetical protein